LNFEFLQYGLRDDDTIAVITLNRPEVRNAQNRGMLVELDAAFRIAEEDDRVRVIVLRGSGGTFSSGHDMGSSVANSEREPGSMQHGTYAINGGTRLGPERRTIQEWHYYFENTRRWRNIRKITIASVQGPVYAAGLMIAWACDLIVAATGTTFADVVATRLGVAGVEYFAHPWELGPRRAKELLLTGDSLSADEAYDIGMVSKVFPVDELEDRTLEFARRIAAVPTFTALLVKDSVNNAVDQMGFSSALTNSFAIHSLNHAYWENVNPDDSPIGSPEFGLRSWKDAGPVLPRHRSSAHGERGPE
jgi:enoyl-CoA hydratase